MSPLSNEINIHTLINTIKHLHLKLRKKFNSVNLRHFHYKVRSRQMIASGTGQELMSEGNFWELDLLISII